MRIRGFVKAVAELLGDRVPSYRRHPRRLGAMGLDLSRTEIQSHEQRLVLAAPEIGASTGEYELSIDGFNSNYGIEVVGGIAYFPGKLGSTAAFKSLNLNADSLGDVEGGLFSGNGAAFATFEDDGTIYFAGFSESTTSANDATVFGGSDFNKIFPDAGNSVFFASASSGRLIGIENTMEGNFAVFADLADNTLTRLPQVSGLKTTGNDISRTGDFIGATASANGNRQVVVYQLVGGVYQVYRHSYLTDVGYPNFCDAVRGKRG